MQENNYKIKFTNMANEDLEQIYDYISQNLSAEISANKLMSKIETSVMRLATFPKSGNLVTDVILRNKGYRKLIVDNYIVFYLIDEEEKQVVIVRILYGARQYENIL